MQRQRFNPLVQGATETALTDTAQLIVGAYVTGGNRWQNLWQVEEVDGRQVWLKKLGTPPVAGGHIHTMSSAAAGKASTCTCGLAVVSLADLMPVTIEGRTEARTSILAPSAPVQLVDRYTIYQVDGGTGSGGLTWLTANRNWRTPLPAIPRLGVVWTLHESLRSLID